jgi:hypothetical protein
VSGTAECSDVTATPEGSYESQYAAMLIVIAQAKADNKDITDGQIDEINANYDLVDEMACYCKARTANGLMFWNLFNIDWADYDPNGKDANNYCMKWQWDSIVKTVVGALSSTSMVVLNATIASLFAKLSKFKKKHTTIEEQSTGFS